MANTCLTNPDLDGILGKVDPMDYIFDETVTNKLLIYSIKNRDAKAFRTLLQNIIGCLTYSPRINIYQYLVIYSPMFTSETMRSFCDSLLEFYNKLLPVASLSRNNTYDPEYDGMKHLHEDKQDGISRYEYYEENNSLTCSWVSLKNKAHASIEVNTHASILARKLKIFISKSKDKFTVCPDMQVSDILIKTLDHINYSQYDPMYETAPYPCSIVSNTTMSMIIEHIKSKKFNNIVVLLNTGLREVFEQNGKSIYHELIIASLYYTLDEIKKLCNIVYEYCSPNNIDKLAKTKTYLGLIKDDNNQVIDVVESNDDLYYKKELNKRIKLDNIVYFNNLRPITLAYVVMNLKTQLNQDTEVIDYVIRTLITINNQH